MKHPFYSEDNNEARRQRAAAALQSYIEGRGEVLRLRLMTEAADLIADLMHWAMAQPQYPPNESTNADYILITGRMHFEAEYGER